MRAMKNNVARSSCRVATRCGAFLKYRAGARGTPADAARRKTRVRHTDFKKYLRKNIALLSITNIAVSAMGL